MGFIPNANCDGLARAEKESRRGSWLSGERWPVMFAEGAHGCRLPAQARGPSPCSHHQTPQDPAPQLPGRSTCSLSLPLGTQTQLL